MKSKEFITEGTGIAEVLAEIASIYNISPETMKQIVAIVRKSGMHLSSIESLIQISQQCQPFIRSVGWDYAFKLFRGVPGVGNYEFIDKKVRLENRTPKSMDPLLFDEINKHFKDMYGAEFRHSMLTTGNMGHTSMFGETFFVFPKGNFKFLWNEKVKDFNFTYNSFVSSDLVKSQVEGSVWSSNNRDLISKLFMEEVVEKTDWHTFDMKSAIDTEAEIMIRPEKGEYWGINFYQHDRHIEAMTEIMKLAV